LPEVVGRLRAVTTALCAALLLVMLLVPAITEGVDPPDLDRFMAALSSVESNGRYHAINASSGAMGKYQIMPANWRQWSRRYLGDGDAALTPANQEAVTRLKLRDLYRWLGDWPAVAHWWLTGDGETEPARWSDFSRDYVNKVLAGMSRSALASRPTASAPGGSEASAPAGQVIDDSRTREVHFSSGWREVAFARYAGGRAHYAVESGATAWFVFSGRSIALIGPMGPTRGQAKVYVDDQLVATIDAYARVFRAQTMVFSTAFERPGIHTIRIEVVGTPGRETVALDEFIVTG
jgi:hypothetical protein